MKYLLPLFLITFFSVSAKAQIRINEEPEITQLIQKYKSENHKKTIVRAWRIQVMTTSDRREMEQGNLKFETLYPHLDYSWEHNPPYYQVRTGAFELREDLEPLMIQLKKDFPAAIPVQDEMRKSELIKN